MTNIVGTKENAIYLAQGYNYDNFGKEEALKSESSFKNDVTFTGAVSDSMTGLYYMNARHYDPDTGRFLQQDTYKGSAAVPWTQHLYAYTGNNPVNMVDPTGHSASMYDQYPDSSYSGIYVPTVTKDNPYGDPRMAGPAPKSSMHDQYADAKNAGRSRPKSVNDASNQYVEPGMGGAYVAPIRNPSEAPLPYDPPALEFASEGIKIPKWVSDAEMIFAGVVGVGTLVYFGGVAVSGWFATHAGTVAATGGGGVVTTEVVKSAPKVAKSFETVGVKITGYRFHGLAQAMSRDGVGVSPQAILDTLRDPLKVINQMDKLGPKFKYVGENAVVVLNEAREVVTTYAKNHEAWRLK
ncbi:Cell wall-associated polypeptide CWBP200 [uncultured Clostridium sp.]|nr:Cell wall-associated polypeptide CWBP200 [uncultured Clostridium sp.]